MRFSVGLLALAQVHVEQVNLAVDRLQLAVAVVDRAGAVHALRFGRSQRDAAADDPDGSLVGSLREKVLDRACPRLLGVFRLVTAAFRHQREVFGQYGDAAAVSSGVRYQLSGRVEIGLDIGPAVHLDGGDSGHAAILTGFRQAASQLTADGE